MVHELHRMEYVGRLRLLRSRMNQANATKDPAGVEKLELWRFDLDKCRSDSTQSLQGAGLSQSM